MNSQNLGELVSLGQTFSPTPPPPPPPTPARRDRSGHTRLWGSQPMPSLYSPFYNIVTNDKHANLPLQGHMHGTKLPYNRKLKKTVIFFVIRWLSASAPACNVWNLDTPGAHKLERICTCIELTRCEHVHKPLSSRAFYPHPLQPEHQHTLLPNALTNKHF